VSEKVNQIIFLGNMAWMGSMRTRHYSVHYGGYVIMIAGPGKCNQATNSFVSHWKLHWY